MFQKVRSLRGERAVHLEAGVRPRPNPFAVVKVWLRCRAITRVRFVIAPAGAQRPRPAGGAVRLVIDVMRLEEGRLRGVVDAVEHAAQLVAVRPRETMAERNVAVGRHAEQAEPRTARVRLAHAFMNLLE